MYDTTPIYFPLKYILVYITSYIQAYESLDMKIRRDLENRHMANWCGPTIRLCEFSTGMERYITWYFPTLAVQLAVNLYKVNNFDDFFILFELIFRFDCFNLLETRSFTCEF